MAFSVKHQSVFVGKTSDCFRIMRGCNKLATGLKTLAKGHHKMSNFREVKDGCPVRPKNK